MMALLKNVGKGILYIIGLPFFLIVLSGTAVFGLLLLVFMFFKSIVLFFTGRSLDDDLPEDIRVKEIKTGRSSSAPVINNQESDDEPVVEPYVATTTSSSIEEAVFGHPTYDNPSQPVQEEPVQEQPIEEESEPVIEEPVNETPIIPEEPIIDEPVSSIEIDNPSQATTEIDIGQYVPRTSGDRFIDEEEEEEDSGVTISYGDDDD